MRVVVCAKQIPDPANPGTLDPLTMRLDRRERPVLDEADSYGVEVALRLVEQAGTGEVTLVSMAPSGETAGLRTALAMGAASAVLVSDEALAGSDALGTARVLAAAIGPIAPDLVVTATESTDGYTGTLPAQLAELLGLPSVTFAKRVELGEQGDTIEVWRQTEHGDDEVFCPLPALVSVTAGAVEPRYPSYRGIMAAKSKPIARPSLEDLGLAAAILGVSGARQELYGLTSTPAGPAGELVIDEGQAHQRIVAFLEDLKVI